MTTHRGTIDWRLILCTALLGLVALLVFQGVENARESREKGERIDRLVLALENERIAADREQERASRERARLLAGQASLSAKYQRLLERQSELMMWLRANGITVPVELVTTTVTTPPSRAGGSTPPKAATPPKQSTPPSKSPSKSNKPPKKAKPPKGVQ